MSDTFFDPKARGRQNRSHNMWERSKKGKKKPGDTTRKVKKFNDPEMVRLQEEFLDTLEYIKLAKGEHYIGTRFEESTNRLNFEDVRYHFGGLDQTDYIDCLNEGDIKVEVINQDTLVTASTEHELMDEPEADGEQRILVLNCACADKFGGGVEKGRNGQEEMIARKTTYPLFINKKTEKMFYPMNEDQMLVTERVGIVKNEDHTKIPIEDVKFFDFLAIAAIRRPGKHLDENDEERFSEEHDREVTRNKIESIFQIGVLGEYKVLVLGAIGCNNYQNPVHEMRDIFIEMIEKYGIFFNKIVFAIKVGEIKTSYEVFKGIEEHFSDS